MVGELKNARKAVKDKRGELRSAATASDDATKAVTGAATTLKDLWLKRAFDISTALFCVAGAVGIVGGLVKANHVKVVPSCKTKCATHFEWSPTTFGLVFGSAATVIALLVLATALSGRAHGGLVSFVLGADDRMSTSKMQVGLWTIAIVFSFFVFTFQLAKGGAASSFDKLDGYYLLLLGGPFAAAVLASAASNIKQDEGSLQKPKAAAPAISDITKSDDGSTSLSDTQFFLFNLVALTYFALAMARHPNELPKLPATLVSLTSLSALTYLGAKVVSTAKPVITSVSIMPGAASEALKTKARRGATIRILGQNFVPTPAQSELAKNLAVVIDGAEVVKDNVKLIGDDEIQLTMPGLAGQERHIEIVVRTTAGAVTDAYKMLIYEPS